MIASRADGGDRFHMTAKLTPRTEYTDDSDTCQLKVIKGPDTVLRGLARLATPDGQTEADADSSSLTLIRYFVLLGTGTPPRGRC